MKEKQQSVKIATEQFQVSMKEISKSNKKQSSQMLSGLDSYASHFQKNLIFDKQKKIIEMNTKTLQREQLALDNYSLDSAQWIFSEITDTLQSLVESRKGVFTGIIASTTSFTDKLVEDIIDPLVPQSQRALAFYKHVMLAQRDTHDEDSSNTSRSLKRQLSENCLQLKRSKNNSSSILDDSALQRHPQISSFINDDQQRLRTPPTRRRTRSVIGGNDCRFSADMSASKTSQRQQTNSYKRQDSGDGGRQRRLLEGISRISLTPHGRHAQANKEELQLYSHKDPSMMVDLFHSRIQQTPLHSDSSYVHNAMMSSLVQHQPPQRLEHNSRKQPTQRKISANFQNTNEQQLSNASSHNETGGYDDQETNNACYQHIINRRIPPTAVESGYGSYRLSDIKERPRLQSHIFQQRFEATTQPLNRDPLERSHLEAVARQQMRREQQEIEKHQQQQLQKQQLFPRETSSRQHDFNKKTTGHFQQQLDYV